MALSNNDEQPRYAGMETSNTTTPTSGSTTGTQHALAVTNQPHESLQTSIEGPDVDMGTDHGEPTSTMVALDHESPSQRDQAETAVASNKAPSAKKGQSQLFLASCLRNVSMPGADNDGNPLDLGTGAKNQMSQSTKVCAAGVYCKKPDGLLRLSQRCMGCGWCTHEDCCFLLSPERRDLQKSERVLPISIRHLCIRCVVDRSWQPKVRENPVDHSHFITITKSVSPVVRMWPSIVLRELTAELEKDNDQEQEPPGSPQESAATLTRSRTSKKSTQTKLHAVKVTKTVKPNRTSKNSSSASLSGQLLNRPYPSSEASVTNNDQMDEGSVDAGSEDTVLVDNNSQANQLETPTAPAGPTEVEEVVTRRIYLDVQLHLPNPGEKQAPSVAFDTMIAYLKTWFQTMQQLNNGFHLHTIDPNAALITELRELDKFPATYQDVKMFFKKPTPKPHGGKLFTKVLASFKGTSSDLVEALKWAFPGGDEGRVSIAHVQAYDTVIVGSLLYSLRSMNTEALTEAISSVLDCPLHIRWMRMADGEPWRSGRDIKADPHALHIECALADQAEVERYFRTTYSSTAIHFPLHIRMRFVPQLSKVMALTSVQKHHLARNRQLGWCLQSKAITMDHLRSIDRPIPNHENTTFRDALMAIRSVENKSQLLFSIDQMWRGSSLIFSFHPRRATEAAMVVKGLYPRMAHYYGADNIRLFFTPEALVEGRLMKYDPDTHLVTSAADESLAALLDVDADMNFEETKTDNATEFGERGVEFVGEKVPGDDETVSTFGPKAASSGAGKAKPRRQTPMQEVSVSQKAHDTDNDDSTTSSLSRETKKSLSSRMSMMELSVKMQADDMAKKMEQMMAAVAGVQSLLVAQAANNKARGGTLAPPVAQGALVSPNRASVSTTTSQTSATTGSLAGFRGAAIPETPPGASGHGS
jgi:Fe-S-cluster-containing dehydrogenase component